MKPEPTIEYSDATPDGGYIFVARKYNGNVVPLGCERDRMIGVSDSKLMGVLASLGHDPVSDRPQFYGKRCWWWFADFADPGFSDQIRQLVLAYYADWNGDRAHLSFVRHIIDRAKGFSNAAKAEAAAIAKLNLAGNIA